MISYGKHSLDEADISSVVDVLKSERLTQGPVVEIFESKLCEYLSVNKSVAVSSGTAALHIACMALDVDRDSLVWITANSFVASANCARYCSASVDFIDIDGETGNISIPALKHKLESTQKKPDVLVVVHFAGNPVDMESIHALSKEYHFKVIEDASHALGSTYKNGNKVGNCEYADVSTFSFHPVKNITTGEGGALTCRSEYLYEKAKRLASHGISKSSYGEPWFYEQVDLGFNYRLSDIHAALGVSQLVKIDKFINKRKEISEIYFENIRNGKIKLVKQNQHGSSSYHLLQVKTKYQLELYNYLKSNGIISQVHYIPIPHQPYYRKLGFSPEDYPDAVGFYNSVLALPIFPSLSYVEITRICEVMNGY